MYAAGEGVLSGYVTNPFIRRWRIREMDAWEKNDIDLVVPAFIEFERHRSGSFQFIAISGGIDWRYRILAGVPTIEWCWDGWNETDPSSGRGWAILDGAALVGQIFIFDGDESRFVADPARSRH